MKNILYKIKNNKTKIMILSTSIILIAISLLLSSYAYLTWTAKEKTIFTATIGEIADVTFVNGNNISGTLYPVFNYTDGLSTSFSVINKNNKTGDYKIDLNINSIAPELANNSLKYAIIKDNVLVQDGNFEGAVSNSTIELDVSSLTPGTSNYKVYIYIDGNIENNPNMANKTFNGNIVVEGINKNLVQTIKLLYNNAPYKNDNVVNNDMSYHYRSDKSDLSSGLMNDGFSASGRVNPDSGNIRYYGASPNNYIQLGDDPVNDLYRIIGVFKNVKQSDGTTKDLIKVIRNDSIGNYSWDTSLSNINSGKGINQWGPSENYEGADLMRLLNPKPDGSLYSGTNGSLWWNSASGSCYNNKGNANVSCNFTSTGLDSTIKNKIANVVWHMGSGFKIYVYSDFAYIMEKEDNKITSPSDGIARTSTWTGKVALMSPSDYGYAVNFENCNIPLGKYDIKDECHGTNWLINGKSHWLLAFPNMQSNKAWLENGSGAIEPVIELFYAVGVRPVFYLDSEITVLSGNGSLGTPYRIN